MGFGFPNIPDMFRSVFTGAPQAVFADMYETGSSFDDALAVMNDDDDFFFSDFYEQEAADDILDADPDAVEKAMYQLSVGGTTSGLTPYGPALTEEAVSTIAEAYPGISSSPEEWWFDDEDEEEGILDSLWGAAEKVATAASDELEAIVDAVGQRLESEGGIGNDAAMLNAIGDQVAEYVQTLDIPLLSVGPGTPSSSPEVQRLLGNLATPDIPDDDDGEDDGFLGDVIDFFGEVAGTLKEVSVGAVNELQNYMFPEEYGGTEGLTLESFFQPEGTTNFLLNPPSQWEPRGLHRTILGGPISTGLDALDYLTTHDLIEVGQDIAGGVGGLADWFTEPTEPFVTSDAPGPGLTYDPMFDEWSGHPGPTPDELAAAWLERGERIEPAAKGLLPSRYEALLSDIEGFPGWDGTLEEVIQIAGDELVTEQDLARLLQSPEFSDFQDRHDTDNKWDTEIETWLTDWETRRAEFGQSIEDKVTFGGDYSDVMDPIAKNIADPIEGIYESLGRTGPGTGFLGQYDVAIPDAYFFNGQWVKNSDRRTNGELKAAGVSSTDGLLTNDDGFEYTGEGAVAETDETKVTAITAAVTPVADAVTTTSVPVTTSVPTGTDKASAPAGAGTKSFYDTETGKWYESTKTLDALNAAKENRYKLVDKQGNTRDTSTAPVGTAVDLDLARTAAATAEGATKLERNTEDLRKVFYQKMYSLPGGASAGRAKKYESLLWDTKSLFFLYTPGVANLYKTVVANTASDDDLKMIENAYDTFLNRYLENPSGERTGQKLSTRIADLNRYFSKSKDEQMDDPDHILFDAFYGVDATGGKSNRERLWSMSITKGQQGYYSDKILDSVSKMAEYYRNTGKTEEEVFKLLTSIGASPTPVPSVASARDPLLPDPNEYEELLHVSSDVI